MRPLIKDNGWKAALDIVKEKKYITVISVYGQT